MPQVIKNPAISMNGGGKVYLHTINMRMEGSFENYQVYTTFLSRSSEPITQLSRLFDAVGDNFYYTNTSNISAYPAMGVYNSGTLQETPVPKIILGIAKAADNAQNVVFVGMDPSKGMVPRSSGIKSIFSSSMSGISFTDYVKEI